MWTWCDNVTNMQISMWRYQVSHKIMWETLCLVEAETQILQYTFDYLLIKS